MSWKSKVVITAALLGFVAFVIHLSLDVRSFRCEACVEFRGREACRTAIGATQEEATRTAIDNACAQIASGVTDSLACSQAPPKSVRCEAL